MQIASAITAFEWLGVLHVMSYMGHLCKLEISPRQLLSERTYVQLLKQHADVL